MDTAVRATHAPIEILTPAEQSAPMVFSSPHSGRDYPAGFLAQSPLDAVTLRRSEDSFVDEIFSAAPRLGAPLLKALFPRAFCDPNREAFELDPSMFGERLPDFVNTRSPRVAAGLGTIARVVASGADIYGRKLRFEEAHARIETTYRPYHAALSELIAKTRLHFGTCVLIECHSMPSIGGPMEDDAGKRRRVDIILGDGHGTTCAPGLTALAERLLTDQGYRVTRNAPYSGGFITRHYGRPRTGVHALQIEINRALYMDECRIERAPSMAMLTESVTAMIGGLCDAGPQMLAA